jgi:hypothetical protein
VVDTNLSSHEVDSVDGQLGSLRRSEPEAGDELASHGVEEGAG